MAIWEEFEIQCPTTLIVDLVRTRFILRWSRLHCSDILVETKEDLLH